MALFDVVVEHTVTPEGAPDIAMALEAGGCVATQLVTYMVNCHRHLICGATASLAMSACGDPCKI